MNERLVCVYTWFIPLCDIVLVDIDECSSSPCENGTICTDAINYTHAIASRVTLEHCETGECMGLS